MKTKINFLCICTVLSCISATQRVTAQQTQAKPTDHVLTQMHSGQQESDYTYKLFQAPNKMFGYDIYKKGKGVFHQPAAIAPPNNIAVTRQSVQQSLPAANDQHFQTDGFSKIELAENAALRSIEKIKKGSAPSLTNDEIKKLMTNNISTPAIKQ